MALKYRKNEKCRQGRAGVLMLPLVTLFCLCSCAHMSPVATVETFCSAYGTAEMDTLASMVTPGFREDKPGVVWVNETWKALHQIEYQRLSGALIGSKVKGDRAVVAMKTSIKTRAGTVNQTELYSLVRSANGPWLLDDLRVTDEKISAESLKL